MGHLVRPDRAARVGRADDGGAGQPREQGLRRRHVQAAALPPRSRQLLRLRRRSGPLHGQHRRELPRRRTLAAELLFAERDLAAAAARRARGELDFLVVVQHNPLWTNHDSRGPLNPSLVLIEEQIFQRYQVDLLLVGHDHFYERSVRMAYGQPGPLGYVQVISGGGGQSLYDFVPEDAFQDWSAAHAKRFHAVHYEVTAGAIRGRAVATDGTGDVLDDFTVARRRIEELVPATPRPGPRPRCSATWRRSPRPTWRAPIPGC